MNRIAELENEKSALLIELQEMQVIDSSGKISINGTYGKLGSPYSFLFAPHLMIQVTITGQLALLMLIEALEERGFSVVSANTDGIVTKVPAAQEAYFNEIIQWWESATGYDTEETRYKAVYSRDVNNYLAIKDDGTVKTKGVFGDTGLMKNPANAVCSAAMVNYLTTGYSIEKFIRECTDIRQFVTVRSVKGGAVQYAGSEIIDDWYEISDREWIRPSWIVDGKSIRATVKRKSRPNPIEVRTDETYIGKVVRWYYGNTSSALYCKRDGSLVPRSEGAVPLMELPDELPDDIDYDWYINEAYSLLHDIGITC